MKDGSFYIVQTELDGRIWLRVTIINPVTSEDDLRNLILKIKKTATDIDLLGHDGSRPVPTIVLFAYISVCINTDLFVA